MKNQSTCSLRYGNRFNEVSVECGSGYRQWVDRQSGAIKDNCGGFPWDVDWGIGYQAARQLSVASDECAEFPRGVV